MPNLIDRIELAKHRTISTSVRDDKIDPFIFDAEHLDLKPAMGKALYYALSVNPTEPRFVNLMDPVEAKHQGIKKVLSLFANARYVLFGTFTDTSFGFVEKSTPDSKPVEDKFKRNISTKDKTAAYEYLSEVMDYVRENSDTYSEIKSGCVTGRSSGWNISKIV